MIRIADICPLVFEQISDSFSIPHKYIQRFHITDAILIQLISDSGEVATGTLNNKSLSTSFPLTFFTYSINDTKKLHYVSLKDLQDGIYTVTLLGVESACFEVSSNENLLRETALIKCSHYDNNSPFNNIWWIGGDQQFISFRVEAGFKPSGVSEKIDNEFFRDQYQSTIQLYSVPYQTKTLSIGNSSGVPYWIGTILNRMLCVSHFEINGERYIRSENSIPEQAAVSEGGQRFWFSQVLELNKNNIAGIGGQPQAADPNNSPAFLLNNLKDGDIVRYSEDESAFINTDYID